MHTLDNFVYMRLEVYQPRPLAVNMTLPTFAAEHRRLLVIDISCPRGAQQQTRRTPLLLSIDGTDGRTDARPLHRPGAAYYANSAKIIKQRFVMDR